MKNLIALLTLVFITNSATIAQSDYLVTTVEFEEERFDFGEANQGEKINHVFKFTNTGDQPLIIVSAKGSCGCTVPFYQKDPIMPGESSEIQVVFNTEGRMGKQVKQVSLVANTEPATSILIIEGMVNTALESDAYKAVTEKMEKDKATLQSLETECIALFPNPSSEIVQLDLKSYIGKSAQVQIFDKAGKMVQEKSIPKISNETTKFDVHAFKDGIYTITIFIASENKYISQCFVVSH